MLNSIYFDGSIEDNFLGHIFAEIYKDRVYNQFFIGRENLTVIDIGAHVGIWTLYASQYASKIFSVEPSNSHFEALLKNIEESGIKDKTTPIQAAITGKDEERTFYHNNNRTMFSLCPEVGDSRLETEKVRGITLKTLFGENKIEHVDFMKLDVEGEEPAILCGKEFEDVAQKIQAMVIEIHSWNGRHPNQLRTALMDNGFKVGQIVNDAQLWYAERR